MVKMSVFDLGSFGWPGVAYNANVNRGECTREVSEVGNASFHPTSHAVKPHRTIGNLADVQRMSIASQGSGACALAVEGAIEVKPKLVVLAYQPHVGPFIDLYGLLGCQALAEIAHAGDTEAYLMNTMVTNKEQLR